MPNIKFQIVEFDDNDLKLLPVSWIDYDTMKVFWPPWPSDVRINKAIAAGISPDSTSWAKCDIKRLREAAGK